MAKKSAKAKDNSVAANVEVSGNVGGSIVTGNNNVVTNNVTNNITNMSPEQIKLSTDALKGRPSTV